jgi:hypothetical protein
MAERKMSEAGPSTKIPIPAASFRKLGVEESTGLS